MESSRAYDIVLFGATGFTGRLVARYLAGVRGRERFRWAIAGRDRSKLDALRRSLVEQTPDAADVPVVVADVGDDASLEAMAASTRVVLTTAGPFNRHGEPVVRACVRRGAHYADLAGEPEYLDAVARRWDGPARDAGVRLVSSCGFDSIPPDVGVYLAVQQLPSDADIEAEGFVRFDARFSGGTWTAAVDSLSASLRRRRGQPPRPVAGAGRSVGALPPRVRHVPERGGWAAPFPTVDPLIVLRSARVLPEYGRDFRYRHSIVFESLGELAMTGLGIGAGFLAAQLPPTRALLYRMRRPGAGPSDEVRARSWFEETFVATAGSRRVVTRVSGGDPGYDETARMCSEAALCLALDELPDRAGALSPVAAMGDLLLERLRAAGLRIETLEA